MLVDLDAAWPKWVETTAKVVTGIAAGALVVGAIVCTGGAAGVVLGIAAGAAVGGVVSGYANEKAGGSYINGFAGGVVSGGIQSAATATPLGSVGTLLGGAANGLGSIVTDNLDNIDHTNDKYKTNTQIKNDASSNAIKGVIYSIPGAMMGGMVKSSDANLKSTQELMPGYTEGFGRLLDQFYGILDNLLTGFADESYHIKKEIEVCIE